MPGINRAARNPSPLPEPTGNATPARSPEAGGGSPSVRRERSSVLGFFTRPFRRSSASRQASLGAGADGPREQGEPARAAAAPRTAAPVL